MPEKVGQRLQLVRKLYGYSQRELAKRAGVANSAISVIEQDSVSPSVSSLGKVLTGFPLSLSHFFSLNISLGVFTAAPAQQCPESQPSNTLLHFTGDEKSSSVPLLVEHYSQLLVISGGLSISGLQESVTLQQGDRLKIQPMALCQVQTTLPLSSWVIAPCLFT